MNIFVDCTFRIVPKGFYQVLIVMCYSRQYDEYLPIYYVLLQSKEESVYKYALEQLQLCTLNLIGHKMEAKTITCDFEKGLINAVVNSFPEAIPIMCLFHFKQAIRKNLLKRFKIPEDLVSELMNEKGLINLLTIIPIDEIEEVGIPYIRENFDEKDYEEKFTQFWKYFLRTWIFQFRPSYWNIHDIVKSNESIMINRTNNPLERFNRELNSAFPTPHPTMAEFITVIRQKSFEKVELIDNIKNKLIKNKERQAVTIHDIPNDYLNFKKQLLKQNKKQKK
jgi:hypothetical protein